MERINFTRYIDIKQNEVASKHFKNFLSLLQFARPYQNKSCKVTKPPKTKLHIYLKTTIGLSSRQCICNFHRSANIKDPKLK